MSPREQGSARTQEKTPPERGQSHVAKRAQRSSQHTNESVAPDNVDISQQLHNLGTDAVDMVTNARPAVASFYTIRNC